MNILTKLSNWKKYRKCPKTLDEAVSRLVETTPEDEKRRFQSSPEDSAIGECHFFGGMKMRNDWYLWEDTSPLSKWFRSYGIWHADDMSSDVFRAFWRHLNGLPFDIKESSERHRIYWEKFNVGFGGKEL